MVDISMKFQINHTMLFPFE